MQYKMMALRITKLGTSDIQLQNEHYHSCNLQVIIVTFLNDYGMILGLYIHCFCIIAEKARLQAAAEAAENARRRAEAEAALEAKRKRDLEREVARQALLKVSTFTLIIE
ncbi:hypothetical protein HanIR_Chr04g0195991 [Helianthus annuus]|nr:hypothetical protein HanIR_Chr04g0195991 [Helianthus annuus]